MRACVYTGLLFLCKWRDCREYRSAAPLRWVSACTDFATPRYFHPPNSCSSASTPASIASGPINPDTKKCALKHGSAGGPRPPKPHTPRPNRSRQRYRQQQRPRRTCRAEAPLTGLANSKHQLSEQEPVSSYRGLSGPSLDSCKHI